MSKNDREKAALQEELTALKTGQANYKYGTFIPKKAQTKRQSKGSWEMTGNTNKFEFKSNSLETVFKFINHIASKKSYSPEEWREISIKSTGADMKFNVIVKLGALSYNLDHLRQYAKEVDANEIRDTLDYFEGLTGGRKKRKTRTKTRKSRKKSRKRSSVRRRRTKRKSRRRTRKRSHKR